MQQIKKKKDLLTHIIEKVSFSIICLYFVRYILNFLGVTYIQGAFWKVIKLFLIIVFVLSLLYLWQLSKSNNFPDSNKKLKILLSKPYKSFVLFFIWSSISILFNWLKSGDELLISNQDKVFDLLFDLLILFPLGYNYAQHNIPKVVKVISNSIMFGLIGICTWIFYNALQLKTLYGFNNSEIGMTTDYGNMRLSINCNPNTTGLYTAVLCMICLLLCMYYKGIIRCIYIYGSVLFYMLLALSGCRSGLVGVLVSVCIFVGMIPFYSNLIEKHMKSFSTKKRIFWSFVGVVVSLLCLLFLRRFAFWLVEIISTAFSGNNTDIIARDINLAASSGRWALWLYSLRISVASVESIIFGYSPAGINAYTGIIDDQIYPQYTHNQFVEVLIGTGYIGLIIFCIWLYYILKRCIKFGASEKLDFRNRFIPLIILGCLISNMFEAKLVFYQFLMGEIFVFLCGFVSGSQDLLEMSKQ